MARIIRFCEQCGAQFYTIKSRLLVGKGKFCSRDCSRVSQLTTADKFWSKANKHGPLHPVLKTRCWNWEGYIHGDGYGCIRIAGVGMGAHRHSWELVYGDIPTGKIICHRCDNRSCVNPRHLFIGDPIDNIHDRDIKGRQARGETCKLTKLTTEQVLAIRKEYDPTNPGLSKKRLAALYGISAIHVRQLVKRKCWKHI